MIDLITEDMESAVQAARRANALLDNAAALLNGVVIHTDWQCPERNDINANTQRNREEAMTLQADAERFYNNILFAAQEFSAAERQIIQSFDAVDGPIAGFLSQTPSGGISIPASLTDGALPSAASGGLADVLQGVGGGVAAGWKASADVIPFDKIADILKQV